MFITPLTLTGIDHYRYSFIKCQVKRWIMLTFCHARVSWNYFHFIWHIFILEIQIHVLWKKILKNDDRTFIGMNSNNERLDYCFYFPCICTRYFLKPVLIQGCHSCTIYICDELLWQCFVSVVAMGSHSGDEPLPVEVFYLVIEMMVSAHSYCIIHVVH